ncbi:RIMS-binding protein 2 isoform X1 [Carassius auratus]|uniref:RIMS-binding protein 2 isoform X1 n=1 Tax=Carassius auratus TaxID=7957 RepID=A0A6P6LEN1_CARAU|nr:RIMS-binding protein 2-like isoform X1 [Carassius auratus]
MSIYIQNGLTVATPNGIENWESEREMFDPNVRLFLALFSYNPAVMSPNPETMEEELPFEQGQIIKVYGDKDADGFYSGETAGRFGFVPSNMVSEIPVEDGEFKLRLFQQGFLPEETPSIAPSETTSVPDGVKVHRMLAIFDYDPWESSPNIDIEDELPFRAGDIIYVLGEMDSDGFYYVSTMTLLTIHEYFKGHKLKNNCFILIQGDLHGYRGLVPSNFLQSLPWD